jgi:hypothetical protein
MATANNKEVTVKHIGWIAAAGMLVSTAAMAATPPRTDATQADQPPAAAGTSTPSASDTTQANANPTSTKQNDTATSAEASDTAAKADATTASNPPLQQQVARDMRDAGFKNVRVMPDSFLVEATDKSGHPVTMMINPDSLTEVVDASAGNGGTQNGGGQNGSAMNGNAMNSNAMNGSAMAGQQGSRPMFVQLPDSDTLSSKVIGLEVRDGNNKDIGTIKDIAYAGARIRAYIVGVGGILGVGDHYVAVNPSDLRLHYDANDRQWHATMNTTEAALKAAPAFDYSQRG